MGFNSLKAAFPHYGNVHCPFQALKDRKASCIAAAIGASVVFEESFIFSYSFSALSLKTRSGYHYGTYLENGQVVHMISKLLIEDPKDIEVSQGIGEGFLVKSLGRLDFGNLSTLEMPGARIHVERHEPEDLFRIYRSDPTLSLDELAKQIEAIEGIVASVV